jgi:hypothetical protein
LKPVVCVGRFRCNARSRCVACVGSLGCPCRHGGQCDEKTGATAERAHTLRLNCLRIWYTIDVCDAHVSWQQCECAGWIKRQSLGIRGTELCESCSTQYLGSFNACNTALRSTRTINDICDHSSLYLNDCIACMLLSTLGTCRGYRMVVDAKLKHANS